MSCVFHSFSRCCLKDAKVTRSCVSEPSADKAGCRRPEHICLCAHIHHFLSQREGGPADVAWAGSYEKQIVTWHLFNMRGLSLFVWDKLTEPWDGKGILTGREKFTLKLKQCGTFMFIPIPFSFLPFSCSVPVTTWL